MIDVNFYIQNSQRANIMHTILIYYKKYIKEMLKYNVYDYF